ncbi:MAG: hypothetical protein ACK4FE_06020 [Azonexus sp.]
MSAFYLLGLFGVWAVLTTLIWNGWRRIHKEAKKPIGIDIAFSAVALVWLAASFWYGGGRKYYYDAEVERLCTIDGGIKVYETVKLPAGIVDKYGAIRIPSKQDAKLSDEYYYESDTTYFRNGNPEMRRSHDRIIRRSDGKVLGEFVYYARRGGDLLGPWRESSFGCPEIRTLPDFERSIFVTGDSK